MYSKLPNLVIGFHGCDVDTYDEIILRNGHLIPSTNEYDWLGNGIYFWEANRQRAQEWAEDKVKQGKYSTPKVIGAIIDLGYCLNLTDSIYMPLLKNGYALLKMRLLKECKNLPTNRLGEDKLIRELDCSVIEQIHDYNFQENLKCFDSVRGVFVEGDEVYEGSGFKHKTHVQICIRNPNCIKGYFNPLFENTRYLVP